METQLKPSWHMVKTMTWVWQQHPVFVEEFWTLPEGWFGVVCSAALQLFALQASFSACMQPCWTGAVVYTETVGDRNILILLLSSSPTSIRVLTTYSLLGTENCFCSFWAGMFSARHARVLQHLSVWDLADGAIVHFPFQEAKLTTVNIHCTECANNGLRDV